MNNARSRENNYLDMQANMAYGHQVNTAPNQRTLPPLPPTLPPTLPSRNSNGGQPFNSLPRSPFPRSNTSPLPLPPRPHLHNAKKQPDPNTRQVTGMKTSSRHLSLSTVHEGKPTMNIQDDTVPPYEEPADALNKAKKSLSALHKDKPTVNVQEDHVPPYEEPADALNKAKKSLSTLHENRPTVNVQEDHVLPYEEPKSLSALHKDKPTVNAQEDSVLPYEEPKSLSVLHKDKPTVNAQEDPVLPYEEPVDALNKGKKSITSNVPSQEHFNSASVAEIPREGGLLLVSNGDTNSSYNGVERINKPAKAQC